MSILILIQLVLAHLINDFIIQRKSWVEDKREKGLRSIYFWIHVILAGAVAYFLLMKWSTWQVPVFIIVTHGIIDYWKIEKDRKTGRLSPNNTHRTAGISGAKLFFIDQGLHFLVIIAAWLYLTANIRILNESILDFMLNKNAMITLTAFIFVIWPAGIAVGMLTEPFKKQFTLSDSLDNAGTYIGIAERILVLIFVLMNQYAAIGFLIAGKSILRVSTDNDEEARKKTEYVLIGTLLSFCFAIAAGLIVHAVFRIHP